MSDEFNPLHSFKNLPPAIENELRNNLSERRFSAGEMVFLQGDSPAAIFLVKSGRVKIVRVTPEGYESILCVRGPGDYFCPVPLLDHGAQLGSAVAMTDVVVYAVNQSEFNQLCQNSPELLAIVQGDCLSEVRHLLNRLEGFAFRQIKERIAIALYNEARRQNNINAPDLNLHLTQSELAGLVGSSRESISRNLKKMEQNGTVILSRGRITINDFERVKALAGIK